MNIKNMKKRARKQNNHPGIDDPGRGQYVFECMEQGICPDCRKAVNVSESTEDGFPVFEIECPACGWQSMVGGNIHG